MTASQITGTDPRSLPEYLKMVGVGTSVEMVKKTALLGSARILKKVKELQK